MTTRDEWLADLFAGPDVVEVRLVRDLTVGVGGPTMAVTRYARDGSGNRFDDREGRATTTAWEPMPDMRQPEPDPDPDPDPDPEPEPTKQWVRPRSGSTFPQHPYMEGDVAMHKGQAYRSDIDHNRHEPPRQWTRV